MSSELSPSESIHDTPLHGEDSLPPELKLKKKDFKRLFDPTRELDGWERYRALIDASDEAYDLIDISNREARFALIVMGGLNALPLLLLTKMDIISAMTRFERMWMVSFLIGYAVLLLYFILQAIEALHPGRFRPNRSRTGRLTARTSPSACATTRTSSSEPTSSTGRRGSTCGCRS